VSEPASVTCVISTWNKRDEVRANLLAIYQQTRLPREVVVVDNHSEDGTAEMIRSEFPAVVLHEMPHSEKGACETFNIGFKAATSEYVAILDDDVVLPPHWIERLLGRLAREPKTTALVTTQVIEPNMPDSYLQRPDMQQETYLCTFRGCGSIVRRDVLEAAEYYDEKFFIYGNERDLAARILHLGYRILLVPSVATFHGTPFGMKAGKRSLYYHVRNFWLYAFKHCAWKDVISVAGRLGMKALGWGGKPQAAAEATGTIGLEKALSTTEGGKWVAIKATAAAFALLPYCLRHRRVCKAPDFRPPLS
jgi:hypothetical protein